jgi:hypothetical protein
LKTLHLVLPLAAGLLLAGCGGETDSAAPAPASSPSTSVASTATAEADGEAWTEEQCAEASMGDWTEHCSAAVAGVAEGGDGLETLPLGKAYEKVDYQSGAPSESMMVKGVRCGIAELAGAADNPKWDGGDTYPRTIDVQAGPGMEFCRVDATSSITGKSPVVGWSDFANLVTADGTEYAEDVVAEEATSTLNYEGPSQCSPTLCDTRNPGTPALDVVKIYQVPTGTKPVGVQWPMETLLSGPEVLFELS